MKPLEFLAEVLPSPGHGVYCVAELSSPRKKEHLFTPDLGSVRPKIKEWLGKGKDVYFALATYSEEVLKTADDDGRFYRGRSGDNTRFLKSMFVDLDGYESKKAAVQAMSAFLEKTGLDAFGTPWVVASGGGVHCYWPLSEAVDSVTWKPVAENFKRLFKQEGMKIDESVTADVARVLRIPGTMNFKKKYGEPQPVKILLEGNACVELRDFSAHIRALLTQDFAPLSNDYETTSVSLEGNRPSKAAEKKSAAAEALLSNAATYFEPIWRKTEQGDGCAQLKFYIDNAQDDGMEPLWRAMLSWAKPCMDGGEYAVTLSKLHPYEPERMRQKLSDIKGPYACAKVDGINGGICKGCKHWGKITNPLALGREILTDDDEKTVLIPIDTDTGKEVEFDKLDIDADTREEMEEDAGPNGQKFRSIQRLRAPKGFSYGEYGGVYRRVKEKDASGTTIDTQVPVLSFDLYVADLLRMDEQDHYIHMMSVRSVGKLEKGEPDLRERVYTPVILPMKSVVSKDELLKHLANRNILASFGRGNDLNLVDYVRGAVEEAANTLMPVEVPTQFGWQKDASFVYNNRIFKPDGREIVVPMPGLENLNAVTSSKGTLDGWREFPELLIKKEHYTMLAMLLDSFGCPLMQFSEYEGFTWHIGSTESGTGKSLTLSAKAAVWGHPIKYRTTKSTSTVTVQQRAGLLKNLPLLMDEITARARNDPEWAPALVFDISEGKGKERMESGTNRERRNNTDWALTNTLTSNTHMTDLLTGGRKHAAEGEFMRMLEWTPTKKLLWTDEERVILKKMRHNYGVAGEAWVRWLVKNRSTAMKVYYEVGERLRTQMAFVDEERYWHSGCVGIVAAAILLGPNYANLLTVPVQKIIDALLGLVNNARENHGKSHRTAEDVLNAYTRDNYGKFVVLSKDQKGSLAHNLGGLTDLASRTSTRGVIMGRIEQELREGIVEYFIEEKLLKMHCAAMSFGYADFKAQMQRKTEEAAAAGVVFSAKFGVKKDLLARTDGPMLRTTVVHFTFPKNALPEELKLGED